MVCLARNSVVRWFIWCLEDSNKIWLFSGMGLGWRLRRQIRRDRENRDSRSWRKARWIIWKMGTDGESTVKKLWKTAPFPGNTLTHSAIHALLPSFTFSLSVHFVSFKPPKNKLNALNIWTGATIVAPVFPAVWRNAWSDLLPTQALWWQPTKDNTLIQAQLWVALTTLGR